MSKQANPTVVGSFVLGAVALGVAAIVVFGSGSLFEKRLKVVAYFEGEVGGLDVGAPVNIQGVRIGSVTEVRLDIDVATLRTLVPVFLELEPKKVTFVGAAGEEHGSGARLDDAVRQGLRAQLATISLVTGQQSVELRYAPSSPAVFRGGGQKLPEIPTIKSQTEQLKEVLGRLPLEKLTASALSAIESADKVLNSPEIPALLKNLVEASASAEDAIGSLRDTATTIGTDAIRTLTAVRAASEEAGRMFADARTAVREANGLFGDARGTIKLTNEVLASNVKPALKSAETAMGQAERTLANINTLVAPNTAQRGDIDHVLRNLASASRALRSLMEELERRPNAIITGR